MPNTSSSNHHHHRAGSLRQSNKANKRSNASKRSQGRRGRVSSATAGTTSTTNCNNASSMIVVAQNRLNRRNQASQRRQNKRNAKVEELRLRNELKIPRVIGVLNLGRTATTCQRLVERLCGGDAMMKNPKSSVIHHGATRAVTADYYPTFRSKATYITLKDEHSIVEALDMARVCDILVCVLDDNVPPPDGPSTFVIHDGDRMGGSTANTNTTTTSRQHKFDPLIRDSADALLQALKAQGLPTPLTVLCHNERTDCGPMEDHGHDDDDDDDDDHDMMTIQTVKSVKSQRRHELHHHQELRKYIYRLAATEFGVKAKVAEVNLTTSKEDDNTSSSVQSLVRTLMTMKCKAASWITESPRSFMIVEETQYNVDGNKNETNTLQVSGYIRGGILDINALFHIPHVGTFAAVWAKNDQGNVVTADPTLRESLDHFATPNALDGEQNLIGFNEEDEEECEMEDEAKPRPAGWSDYQNAWLDAIDDDPENDDDCDVDHGELADELNTKHSHLTNDDGQDMLMDDVDDENVAVGKTMVRTERRKQFQEDARFPDEVQVPEDIPARDRFQRYRSLKNFRKTHWDPKENLPQTYANIYHFRNFAQTQKIVMKDMKELEKAAEAVGYQFFGKGVMTKNNSGPTVETKMNVDDDNEAEEDEIEEDDILAGCIPSGSYVTLCLENVTPEDIKRLPKTGVLSVVSLLPHENKVSVLNVGLKHCNPGCSEPVKSKDVLTFRCGWRTWTARPVFSQHNLNSDKHKLERFLPDQNVHICASLFGPVTYTPCPVLVFRGPMTNPELVGMGNMLSASADRIVVKRILLTGYPVKVRKRTAIVKYMFYNPEDVKWFQPAGLYTKHGLNGHTIQSVGEHGTMKCLFNAPIHQHDTVCLPLYKRIFPKYVTDKDGQDTLEIR